MRALGLLLSGVLLLGACGGPDPGEQHIAIRVGPHEARVRVVRRSPERRAGLQGVTALGADEGMLFLYRRPGARRIWMQGCKLDLDVAFLDERGRILEIATLAAPRAADPEPQRAVSKRPASMVLEMHAGWLARHGVGVGTQVRLPDDLDREDADP